MMGSCPQRHCHSCEDGFPAISGWKSRVPSRHRVCSLVLLLDHLGRSGDVAKDRGGEEEEGGFGKTAVIARKQ